MRLSFSKEDMYTGSGFVLDSFEAHQAQFVAVTSEDDFGVQFLTDFLAARAAAKGLAGAGLNIGAVSQLTQRLYTRMDDVLPWLDKLDIRLGLIDAKQLTVPAKDFGIANLRRRIQARDAEGTVKALGKLNKAIADNLSLLEARGHKVEDTTAFADAETKIDEDNRKQNTSQNNVPISTQEEAKILKTLDAFVKKVTKTGAKLFKRDKVFKKHYTVKDVVGRMHAGERPKPRPADAGAPAGGATPPTP